MRTLRQGAQLPAGTNALSSAAAVDGRLRRMVSKDAKPRNLGFEN